MPLLAVGRERNADVELYYEDVGDGPPVVLVAGWPFGHACWEPQVGALVAAGLRVVTYDRRGFGGSTRAWSGYDGEGQAADLRLLIRHLGLRGVTVVGHSSGTAEAARCTARLAAGRVARLVLASPVVVRPGSELVADLLAAAARHRIAMLDDVLRRFFAVRGEPALDEPTRAHLLHVAAAASPRGTAEIVRGWSDRALAVDLARLRVPVLVLHGAEDAFMPYASSGRWVSRTAPAARTVLLADAPHGAPLTHAEEWTAAVLHFIRTTP
ncbi:alpha/beta hydrolase [Streptomyces sp. NPDC051940]|uniref:alpha/beta fold hydrolase n=1 Tax=Streptomyces sp. NPDC051940 TaxID=3155675 RepID=UPI003438B015